ncbi:MAG: pseudouridine-5'-phosphate glycosidase [Planctomycetes bacterium]|nr:pseudouridine-5'-phosphate glycosidase [Planctomycetota bacterium]MCP4838168.1 pseudouridine-5'-phosphate glycosidase [Planctomycetota bacterium]
MTSTIQVHGEVIAAARSGKRIVLLETAVLTCGLPRTPWKSCHGPCPPSIEADEPLNLACMRGMISAIRRGGCVPAITAVVRGTPRIGLSEDELTTLAMDATAGKASLATIGRSMASGASAGTTVSATLRLAATASYEGLPHPRVFATGGIGGVHEGWADHLDISADLGELASRQICVVCAGAKSIIDAGATAELLETLGVPILGLKVDRMPGFQCDPSESSPAVMPVDAVRTAAAISTAHWSIPSTGGVLLTQPPPQTSKMSVERVADAVRLAEETVTCTGPARTPALLDAMAQLTDGATLRANIDLLISNATTAAELALAIDS